MTTDLVARTAQIAANARTKRERNRREMPTVAALLDDVRKVFGDPVYLRFTEAGHEIAWGRRPDWIDR